MMELTDRIRLKIEDYKGHEIWYIPSQQLFEIRKEGKIIAIHKKFLSKIKEEIE